MSNTDTYTVSHAIDALGFGPYQIVLSLVVGMAYVADAMEMMLLSVLAPALHCHWQITQLQQASLTTVVFFGKFLTFCLPFQNLTCRAVTDFVDSFSKCKQKDKNGAKIFKM